MSFEETWKLIKDRGVPIVAIECADPLQPGQIICSNGASVFAWDILKGFHPVANDPAQADALGRFANTDGAETLRNILDNPGIPQGLTAEPITAIDFLRVCSSSDRPALEDTVVLMLGAHKLLQQTPGNEAGSAKILQALYNIRDAFTAVGNTLVLLGPSFELPTEIANDVYVVSYPLPSDEDRIGIIGNVLKDGGSNPPKEEVSASIYATKGLTLFATEQAIALSLKKKSIDVKQVRQWWKKSINATKGLTVIESSLTLDNIAGLNNLKDFARKVCAGKDAPGAIIWVEEIEKAMAGSSDDNTGVSQDILGQILTHMQESESDGIIAVGPGGTGKSLSAEALGSAGGIPTIRLDIGGLKDSLVGASEGNVRAALKTISALAGRSFWLATCNSLSNIRPELKRRFTYGIWYFDLPDEIESEALWAMYLKKYDVPDERPENYTGWTGAEIKTACKTAYKLNVTPREAAKWIVPVAQSAVAEIKALREQANGRYTSASYEGPYLINRISEPKKSRRRIQDTSLN